MQRHGLEGGDGVRDGAEEGGTREGGSGTKSFEQQTRIKDQLQQGIEDWIGGNFISQSKIYFQLPLPKLLDLG